MGWGMTCSGRLWRRKWTLPLDVLPQIGIPRAVLRARVRDIPPSMHAVERIQQILDRLVANLALVRTLGHRQAIPADIL